MPINCECLLNVLLTKNTFNIVFFKINYLFLKTKPHPYTINYMHIMNGFFFQSLESELICSTAYVELFIRRITEPKLLAIFLRFLFTEAHDQDTIIDIMVHRLTLQSQVSSYIFLREIAISRKR